MIVSVPLYLEPIIIGEHLVTSQYCKHFHAYEVHIGQQEEVFSLQDISDFHVLSFYQSHHLSIIIILFLNTMF